MKQSVLAVENYDGTFHCFLTFTKQSTNDLMVKITVCCSHMTWNDLDIQYLTGKQRSPIYNMSVLFLVVK